MQVSLFVLLLNIQKIMKENLHLFLCSFLVISALISAFSPNPVESILFLIFSFYLAAILLFFFNVEFLGLTYIVVYVGAVAVLFLFIIMMLDIKMKDTFFSRNKFLIYTIVGLFAFSTYKLISCYLSGVFSNEELISSEEILVDTFSNLEVFGQVLYNYYTAYFLFAGIILLIALVGCIYITIDYNKVGKKINN